MAQIFSNVDAPYGFLLYRNTGKVAPYRTTRAVVATRTDAIFRGDALNTAAGVTIRQVAGSDVTGICEDLVLAPQPGIAEGVVSQYYINTTEAGSCIVIEDTDALFKVQATTAAATDVETAADLVNTDGDTTLGNSKQELNGAAYGATGQFMLEDLVKGGGLINDWGSNADVVVRIVNL